MTRETKEKRVIVAYTMIGGENFITLKDNLDNADDGRLERLFRTARLAVGKGKTSALCKSQLLAFGEKR